MNTKTLKSLHIPLPPPSLQHEFVARVAEVRALEETQRRQGERLGALFESMLARAFAGQL